MWDGQPFIRPAARVTGRTLAFRDAAPDDAAFIHRLRTTRGEHLSATGTAQDQRDWLCRYQGGTGQAYFIIEHQGQDIGTVRLYDAQGPSFCWGSWIIERGPTHAAIESALMVYVLARREYGFIASHFDVRRGNESVWRFHERFGAKRERETDLDYFYRLDLDGIESGIRRYGRYIHGGIEIDHQRT